MMMMWWWFSSSWKIIISKNEIEIFNKLICIYAFDYIDLTSMNLNITQIRVTQWRRLLFNNKVDGNIFYVNVIFFGDLCVQNFICKCIFFSRDVRLTGKHKLLKKILQNLGLVIFKSVGQVNLHIIICFYKFCVCVRF